MSPNVQTDMTGHVLVGEGWGKTFLSPITPLIISFQNIKDLLTLHEYSKLSTV